MTHEFSTMTMSEMFTTQMKSVTITPIVVAAVALMAPTLPASAKDSPQRAQVQANFQAADVDRNGQLNLTEFTMFINLNADHKLGQAASIRRFGMYTKAFKKADANGDGVVIKEEIAAQVQQ